MTIKDDSEDEWMNEPDESALSGMTRHVTKILLEVVVTGWTPRINQSTQNFTNLSNHVTLQEI